MLVWVWKGREEEAGGEEVGMLQPRDLSNFLVFTHAPTTPHPTYTIQGGRRRMKKRPRPASSSGSTSSSSSSANALVSSSMARVSSLAGWPSDEAVARLIALEVCGELDEQKRVVMGTEKCRNTNTQNCATRPNRRLPLPAEDKA